MISLYGFVLEPLVLVEMPRYGTNVIRGNTLTTKSFMYHTSTQSLEDTVPTSSENENYHLKPGAWTHEAVLNDIGNIHGGNHESRTTKWTYLKHYYSITLIILLVSPFPTHKNTKKENIRLCYKSRDSNRAKQNKIGRNGDRQKARRRKKKARQGE